MPRIPFIDDANEILTGEAFADDYSTEGSESGTNEDNTDRVTPVKRKPGVTKRAISVKRAPDPTDEKEGEEESTGGSRDEGNKPRNASPGKTSDEDRKQDKGTASGPKGGNDGNSTVQTTV